MATTQNTYTGNGSTTNYSFTFPYIQQADVKASLDGTPTTAFTLANATTVSFNTAPANGVNIIIFRDTDNDTRAATFFAGSAIKAEDLNLNFDQITYVSQETENNAMSALGDTMSGQLNMSNQKIVSLGTPTADADASTKGYVDGLITTHQAQVDAAAASATAAATSETNAATSATNSATSATASAGSATTSTTQATNSANSATASATSATAAANSATAAATSATTATQQATTASQNALTSTNQATNSANSATQAATSATDAATSATNASNSATSAATSAAAAAAAFDNFDDTYLGQKASDPTTDNDGDALTAGDLYFNTTDNVMKVYIGSSWVTAYVPGDAANITNTASGNLTSTNVQDSLQELQGDIDTKMPLAGGTFTGNISLLSQVLLQFKESAPQGNNYVALRAPSQVASNVVWELPFEDGLAGQALVTNGSGFLSWAAAGGASGAGTNLWALEHDNTISGSYTIGAGKNVVSAGPLTVNSGVTVTVPAGSNWVIV